MKRITAFILSFMLIAPSVFAEYDEATGKYTDTHKTETTEELYQNRPFILRMGEYLNRGLTAVPSDNGVLVSWRFLGTDSQNLRYNLYKDGVCLNSAPISVTNYFDENGAYGDEYVLAEVIGGIENGKKEAVKAWDNNYYEFNVIERNDYIIDDGGVGDLDGDGEYEYLIRRTPIDMVPSTRTVYPLIEAYDTDGTHMWTINIGPNEINEHDINFMSYDFNSDGKNEVILRSFEGTVDGKGNAIPDTDGDGITDYTLDESNLAIFTDRQYVIRKPEFVSMYDGVTGEEIARCDMLPAFEPLSNWSFNYSDTGRLTKRANHYLWGVAYLDGKTPSIVSIRGAWDNVNIAAWHIENNEFVLDWQTNTPNRADVNSIYGAVNHNCAAADIDFDGKDEIFSGPMAVDHDGNTMYAVKAAGADGVEVKLGHGDAFDMAKMSPDFNGYLTWACHETKNLPSNIELHDGRTGQVIWGYTKPKDTGRSRAADIDPNYRGFEVWGSTATIPSNISGENITTSAWNKIPVRQLDGTLTSGSIPMNFKLYWDGDLLGELLDGIQISKWDYENKEVDILFNMDGCVANGGTKAVPCISADLFGDWREEVVFKTADEKALRVYSTAIPTSYKIHTLMHDSAYRSAVAVQNNHYNQPPNVSYYLGAETVEIQYPEIQIMYDGKLIQNPDLADTHKSYTVIPPEAPQIGEMTLKDNTVSVTAKNIENGVLLLASYSDDGELLNLRSENISDKEMYTFEVDNNAVRLTAFVWNSLNDLIPLCEKKSITR